jgi:hypothetical protein
MKRPEREKDGRRFEQRERAFWFATPRMAIMHGKGKNLLADRLYEAVI